MGIESSTSQSEVNHSLSLPQAIQPLNFRYNVFRSVSYCSSIKVSHLLCRKPIRGRFLHAILICLTVLVGVLRVITCRVSHASKNFSQCKWPSIFSLHNLEVLHPPAPPPTTVKPTYTSVSQPVPPPVRSTLSNPREHACASLHNQSASNHLHPSPGNSNQSALSIQS